MPTVESYASLIELSLEELQERCKKYASTLVRLDSLREKETRSRPQVGKVMAAYKRVFAEKVNDGSIPEGTPFAEYFKIATGKAPSGRIEQCANTFNSFVVSDLITEQDYDFCATDWIEKASAIVKAAKNDLGNPSVLDTASLLKARPSDIAKKLNLIKAELRGKTKEVDKDGDVLNLERVVGFVKMASEKGYGADIVTTIDTLIREHGSEWDEQVQRNTFVSCEKLLAAWTETVGEATIDGWLSEAEKANAPVQLIAKSDTIGTPEPVETPAPDFEEHARTLYGKKLPKTKVAAAARMISSYHEVNHSLPETAEALNAFAEQAVTAA